MTRVASLASPRWLGARERVAVAKLEVLTDLLGLLAQRVQVTAQRQRDADLHRPGCAIPLHTPDRRAAATDTKQYNPTK